MSDLKTPDLLAAMMEYYESRGYLAVPELRVTTGFKRVANNGEQRLDLFALHPTDNDCERIVCEIKASKADFKNELKKPTKRRMGLLYSNLFYFVAPKGMIKPEDVPPECGLIEVSLASEKNIFDKHALTLPGRQQSPYHLRVVIAAPWRDTVLASWRFVAAMVRATRHQTYRAAITALRAEVAGLDSLNSPDILEGMRIVAAKDLRSLVGDAVDGVNRGRAARDMIDIGYQDRETLANLLAPLLHDYATKHHMSESAIAHAMAIVDRIDLRSMLYRCNAQRGDVSDLTDKLLLELNSYGKRG